MSFDEMVFYLNSCLKQYHSSLKVLVLTGGEAFLLGEDLDKIVKYATEKGLITRIVSNAYWATSYENAYKRLLKLKENGLKEINYSTGDEHQKWVPFTKIKNATKAAVDLELICAINVETHDGSSFIFETEAKKDETFYQCIEKGCVNIEHGAWISMEKENSYENGFVFSSQMPCTSILDVITINPYGEVLACCGLRSEQNPYLRLGNIRENSIKSMYESSTHDVIKMWLHVEGPNKILDFVNNKKGSPKRNYKCHICASCSELFKDSSNIEILKRFKSEYTPSIYLKYLLTTKKEQV